MRVKEDQQLIELYQDTTKTTFGRISSKFFLLLYHWLMYK